jgi:hypothetical protein
MVNPDTKALMIVYDDAQAIYKGRKRPVWKQLGIEAAGRTTVLKVNYRNTAQILRFARKFAADVIGAPGVCAGDEDAILMPEDGGRQGVEPVVRQCGAMTVKPTRSRNGCRGARPPVTSGADGTAVSPAFHRRAIRKYWRNPHTD